MQPMSTFAPHTPPTSASAWIEQWAHLVDAGGAVLDVASGNGRHARYFASRGHAVLALDRDAAALANLDGVAHVTTRQMKNSLPSW
jgi:SAM-dependent methyltransferase